MPSGETTTQGSELTFYRVSRHHAGVYECVAKNKLGAARTAVSLVVTRKWLFILIIYLISLLVNLTEEGKWRRES